MATQSILGVLTKGTTTFPTAYNALGTSITPIGNNFATVTISVTAGNLSNVLPGDAITTDVGGAIATVTSVNVPGSYLVINTISGNWPAATVLHVVSHGVDANIVFFEGVINAPGFKINNNFVTWRSNLYTQCFYTVYKYNFSTTNWEEAYRIGNAGNGNGSFGFNSLHFLTINGVQNMVFCYGNTTSKNIYRVKTVDGVTFSEANLGNGSVNLEAPSYIVWNNLLVTYGTAQTNVQPHIYVWDPVSDTLGDFALAPPPGPNITDYMGSQCQAVVCQNRLFFTVLTGYGNIFTIFYYWVVEFTGTGFTRIGTLPFPSSGYQPSTVPPSTTGMWPAPDGSPAFYVLNYVYNNNSSPSPAGAGFYLTKVSFPGNVFGMGDLTPLILNGYRFGQMPINPSNNGLVNVLADTISNATAGGPPIIQIFMSPTDSPLGTLRDYTNFVDDLTVWTPLAPPGIEQAITFVADCSGGGERIWYPGVVTGDITVAPVPALGGDRFGFTLYPPPGTPSVSNVSVRLQYNIEGEAPVALGTLTNPVASPPGPVLTISNPGPINGNQINGLVADGTTVYSVTWLAISQDGLSNFTDVERSIVIIA